MVVNNLAKRVQNIEQELRDKENDSHGVRGDSGGGRESREAEEEEEEAGERAGTGFFASLLHFAALKNILSFFCKTCQPCICRLTGLSYKK